MNIEVKATLNKQEFSNMLAELIKRASEYLGIEEECILPSDIMYYLSQYPNENIFEESLNNL